MGQIDSGGSGDSSSAGAVGICGTGNREAIDLSSSTICHQLHITAVLFVAQVFDNRFYHPVKSSDGSPSLGVGVSVQDAHKAAAQTRGVAVVRSMFTQEFQTQLLQVQLPGERENEWCLLLFSAGSSVRNLIDTFVDERVLPCCCARCALCGT